VEIKFETLELHTKRLLKKLPTDIPKFQLCVSSLYVRTGNRCRIIVMRADPENIPRLQEEMNKLNANNTVPFFHWGEYLSLTMDQKENVINHQNKWNANVRNLLLTGFTSIADKIPMKSKDETDMDTNNPVSGYLLETNITEYFRKHVAAGNGKKLFSYVYQPINGTYSTNSWLQRKMSRKQKITLIEQLENLPNG
jgi:hypothetical protein